MYLTRKWQSTKAYFDSQTFGRDRPQEKHATLITTQSLLGAIDKLDPRHGSHFLTKSVRNRIVASPQTFNGRRCRIRDVVQFLLASRAGAADAGIPQVRAGEAGIDKTNPQNWTLDGVAGCGSPGLGIIREDPLRSLFLELTPKIWRMGCPDFPRTNKINKLSPCLNTNISFKGSYQPKASPHMRNLKYRGKYSNYRQPNNHGIRLRKKKPSYTLFNMDNFTMGNQMFELSHHLLYYFMNLYLHVLIILNPPLPPLNGNRE